MCSTSMVASRTLQRPSASFSAKCTLSSRRVIAISAAFHSRAALCLTDCFRYSCTLCLKKTDELLYEWKANAEFSKGISQALQTYTEYEGEENLDVQGYQLPTPGAAEAGKINIASLHKSLHSIYLIYRASPTNDVTLAQLVVAPDESVQKIVSFISTLSQLVPSSCCRRKKPVVRKAMARAAFHQH